MLAKHISAIPVFYCPEIVAESGGFSPSAAKPAAVVSRWQRLGIPIDIRAPTPVTVEQLKLAHEARFVDEILELRQANGFGNRSAAVAATLPLTSGAMLAAAREAIRNQRIAVAPVSGFHHARHDQSSGFCTFNGLIVTAQVLLSTGEARKIGVLDFDQHYGDGTEDCIEVLGVRGAIEHYSAGGEYYSLLQAESFLERIPEYVSRMVGCDVLLYQAGADPHINDPLGGWLTDVQLAQRDQIVFREAHRNGIPIAWNLAGGYQQPIEKVLRIHDATLTAAAREHLQSDPPTQ